MDCIVHGVAKNQTQLSDFHIHFQHSFATGSSDCMPRFFTQLFLKAYYSQKDQDMNVCSNFNVNCQKLGATNMPFNR